MKLIGIRWGPHFAKGQGEETRQVREPPHPHQVSKNDADRDRVSDTIRPETYVYVYVYSVAALSFMIWCLYCSCKNNRILMNLNQDWNLEFACPQHGTFDGSALNFAKWNEIGLRF